MKRVPADVAWVRLTFFMKVQNATPLPFISHLPASHFSIAPLFPVDRALRIIVVTSLHEVVVNVEHLLVLLVALASSSLLEFAELHHVHLVSQKPANSSKTFHELRTFL